MVHTMTKWKTSESERSRVADYNVKGISFAILKSHFGDEPRTFGPLKWLGQDEAWGLVGFELVEAENDDGEPVYLSGRCQCCERSFGMFSDEPAWKFSEVVNADETWGNAEDDFEVCDGCAEGWRLIGGFIVAGGGTES